MYMSLLLSSTEILKVALVSGFSGDLGLEFSRPRTERELSALGTPFRSRVLHTYAVAHGHGYEPW